MTDKTIQDKAEELVRNEVLCCLSMMMCELQPVAEQLEDYETFMELHRGVADFEEVGSYFITKDADLDQLQEIAEHFGDWNDVLDDIGYGVYEATCKESDEDPIDVQEWLDAQDACHTPEESFWKAIRKCVGELVSDWVWVGNEYGLEPDEPEVYEHWAVTDWFGRQLGKRGERVENYMGLTIWGRCATGQSISMDYVIQQIAKDQML